MPFQSAFHQLFTQDATIAAVVFGLVVLVLLTSLLLSWRRRRRGRDASGRAEANKLEISYVAALLGIAIFLMISSVYANARDFSDPPKPALRVQVIGYQWCWRFRYEGQPVTVTGQCTNGSYPTLVLPVGRPVELDVTSIDVIHGFWVPYLRAKMYAYPGHTNRLTVTLSHAGRWIGRCAQLCGLYHYEMDFYLQAVSPSAYGRFLRTRGGTSAGVTP